MKLIDTPCIIKNTTITKVDYKGNVWERRSNDKFITWFVYNNNCSRNIFIFQKVIKTNTWRVIRSYSDNNSLVNIEIPYVELSYLRLINPMRLYKFSLDLYNASLYGMFVSTRKEVDNLVGTKLYFGEVDGKHSDVVHVLSWDDIEELVVNQTTLKDLLVASNKEVAGNVTILGYNPFDYLEDKMIL